MKLEELRRHWDEFGRTDPFWAVLTDPARKDNRWGADEFYETGIEEVGRIIRQLEQFGVPRARSSALDFGCGVGRITVPLAEHFDRVVGVDISASMLERAREATRLRPGLEFVLNVAPDLAQFPDAQFDFIYCRLVLQHIAPIYSRNYISEFLRIVRPGGAVLFQVPTPRRDRRPAGALRKWVPMPLVRVWRGMKPSVTAALGRRQFPLIEDYGMSRSETIALVEAAGRHVLDVRPDDSHGVDRPGYEYLVTRP